MDSLREKMVYFDASTDKTPDDPVTLNSLVKNKLDEDEFNAIFGITDTNDVYQHLNLKLDKKTKYIHDQNYFVKSYNSNDIYLGNGAIIYKEIEKIPNGADKDRLVRSNLFDQAMLMTSIYMGFVDDLNPSFVKEHFSEFSKFIPEDDVNYYAGIIERGAGIYYSEFIKAKNEREISQYKEELDGSDKSTSASKALVKSTAAGKIYEEADELKPGAFISVYFYAMVTMVGFIIGVIYLFAVLLK